MWTCKIIECKISSDFSEQNVEKHGPYIPNSMAIEEIKRKTWKKFPFSYECTRSSNAWISVVTLKIEEYQNIQTSVKQC